MRDESVKLRCRSEIISPCRGGETPPRQPIGRNPYHLAFKAPEPESVYEKKWRWQREEHEIELGVGRVVADHILAVPHHAVVVLPVVLNATIEDKCDALDQGHDPKRAAPSPKFAEIVQVEQPGSLFPVDRVCFGLVLFVGVVKRVAEDEQEHGKARKRSGQDQVLDCSQRKLKVYRVAKLHEPVGAIRRWPEKVGCKAKTEHLEVFDQKRGPRNCASRERRRA